jgi:Matrixin
VTRPGPFVWLFGVVVVLAGFIYVQARSVARPPPAPPPADSAPPAGAATPDGGVPIATRGDASVSRDARLTAAAAHGLSRADIDEAKRQIADAREGTYFDDVLRDADSVVIRWPPHDDEPLRIWIQPSAPFADWSPDDVREATHAFEEWTRTGIPMRFLFVVDSSHADVPLVWIDRFPGDQRIGNTHITGLNGVIDHGTITVALHTQWGYALAPAMIHATVLHEVGHLLGLPHTADSTSIMTPQAHVHPLSESDRRTVRLLYTLPTGSLRIPPP